MRLEFKQQDLSDKSLPSADLVLGVHPGPFTDTQEKLWSQIIANVVKSSGPDSCCVFATQSYDEAVKVQSICKQLGDECEIRENPYYADFPANYTPVHLRFIAMVKRSV